MRILAISLILLTALRLPAQDLLKIITPTSVEKIERVLAADSMRGRATFTPDIERAADYLEAQFKNAGLKTYDGSDSYRQPFSMIRTTPISSTATLDGNPLPDTRFLVITSSADFTLDETNNYQKVFLKPGADLRSEVRRYIRGKTSTLIFVDSSYAATFSSLARSRQQFNYDRNIVFILTAGTPTHYSIHLQQQVTESKLANVVGILPGTTKKQEFVIFSGHYDHLGVKKPDAKGDSIYNGANDDASGTTAVILLARYFAKKKNNTRTLVFAAFTAEEIGEFGSQYFSEQFDPAAVVAMFNIEMIGSESKWGGNSAFITGYERSDMGKILSKNLAKTAFTFYPDPYTDQQLFYRSDNASLAKLGVPAHTISTTKIDVDKYYHTPEDEIGTIDMQNMARIIKAIALSSTSIVEGKDTPTRVDTTQLR
jgi:Zn-dependent M28 family amino/carboxypeptidase